MDNVIFVFASVKMPRKRDDDNDDASIAFSVDPMMYEKVGVLRPRRKDDVVTDFDQEKLYMFQLDKDLKKIVAERGHHADRDVQYIKQRMKMDPKYKSAICPTSLGKSGNFAAVSVLASEKSWMATSVPYGDIAHKRYLEWLSQVPKGPSEAELKMAKQIKMDQELWQKIQ